MLDLDLMAAVFNLSRVLNVFFISVVSQGVDLSDTLRSMSNACFSTTTESMFVHFCTTSLMSWLQMRILCQLIAARSLRNSSSFKLTILRVLIIYDCKGYYLETYGWHTPNSDL